VKKFNFSKLLITALIILVTAILAVIISVQNYKNHRQPSVMTQMINDGTGWVDGFVGAPIRYVQDKSNQIDDMLHAYQQNESLKSELVASQPDKDKLDAIQSENKQLKDALKLKDTLTNYDTISATVISRDPNSWDDTLTINSGKQDGLVDNMVVMANGGVIGRISQVNQNSSKVALFNSSKGIDNKLPVQLGSSDSPTYGILSSYDSKQNAFVITLSNTQGKIATGSKVLTSGLGGDSPKGLLVGTVIGEKDFNQGLSKEIYVSPASSLYDIQFVFVVKSTVGGN